MSSIFRIPKPYLQVTGLFRNSSNGWPDLHSNNGEEASLLGMLA